MVCIVREARGEISGENIPAAFISSGLSVDATENKDLMFVMGQLRKNEFWFNAWHKAIEC